MFLPGPQKDRVNLIISVQSSVVRASLVRLHAGAAPLVFFDCNQAVPYRPRPDEARLIEATLKAVEGTVSAAARELHLEARRDGTLSKSVFEVHFVLSSPWIVSNARVVKRSFDRPTAVTKKSVLDIVSRERSKYSAGSGNLEIVEEKIFDVKLNGYSIGEWEGKCARSVEVSFAVSLAGKGMIEKFHEACSHLARARSVNFHSSLLLQHVGIQAVLPHKTSYALIHAHGELTDMVIVENRSCVFFGSFPSGVNTIIRSIARATDTPEQVVDSLLAMHLSGHAESPKGQKAAKAVEEAAVAWTEEIAKLLKQSTPEAVLPKAAIITARVHEDFLARSFKERYTGTSVETLTAETFSRAVSFGPKVELLRVLSLYVVAIDAMK